MESKFNQNTMDSRFQQSNHTAELLAEQIKLLYQQAPKALIVSLIIAAALTFVFWNLVAKIWLVGWLAAIYLLTFV